MIAVLALVGFGVAVYLTLYKFGVVGTLACGTGQCEVVQTSRWSVLLGLPIAAWGAGYYALVLIMAAIRVRGRYAASPAMSIALMVVTAFGLLFSAWLTYLELFVIHAICRYCVISATIAVLLFIVAAFDWYEAGADLDDEIE